MKRNFESLTAHRALVAAAVATSILIGVQIVQRIVSLLLDFIVFFAQRDMTESWSSMFSFSLWGFVIGGLTFALGYFLCVWLLAPIAADLRLFAVVGRSLLAVASGVVVAFIAGLLGSIFSGFDESAGLVFGWGYGALATASGNIGWASTQAIYSALSTAVSWAPLAVLAGVLVWIWLRTQPLGALTQGNADEV